MCLVCALSYHLHGGERKGILHRISACLARLLELGLRWFYLEDLIATGQINDLRTSLNCGVHLLREQCHEKCTSSPDSVDDLGTSALCPALMLPRGSCTRCYIHWSICRNRISCSY